MHEVRARVEELAEFFENQAEEAETLQKLPVETVKKLKQAGVIRMLQPKEYGGYEAHPAEWLDAAAAVGARCGSSGWLCGIVGVHPWHLGVCDPKVQQEVWGKDPDTWIASPYAPMGTARLSDDGYILNGQWSFSSGTDHCDWIFLGGVLVDADGKPTSTPPQSLHFILPRKDYEIVPDSWNVVGLKGTGSKDIIVRNAYVPAYRTIDTVRMRQSGVTGGGAAGRTEPLYQMPFSGLFGAAICAGVLGAAEGLIAQAINYQRDRVGRMGNRWAEDPLLSHTLGEATSDIQASRVQMTDDLSRMFDLCAAGQPVPYELRLQTRRNQVRSVQRIVDASDKVFTRTGGNAIRTDKAMQRLWRDTHAGLHHGINVPSPMYAAYSALVFGLPQPAGIGV